MHRLKYWLLLNLARLRWMIFRPYYTRLMVQAHYLYGQSDLYKHKWESLGLEFADSGFEENANYFFWKAQQSSWIIKRQIIADMIMGRPARPYCLSDD
jgi:hypothetical protein